MTPLPQLSETSDKERGANSYFTPEDISCIAEFNTRDTVLALGSAVSESANVILRQVESAIKACVSDNRAKPATAA